jgi:hypothetical protein
MSPEAAGGPSGADLAGLGLLLAAAFVVPLVVGSAVDGLLHRGPVFLLIGLFVGIAGTVAVLYVGYVKRFM